MRTYHWKKIRNEWKLQEEVHQSVIFHLILDTLIKFIWKKKQKQANEWFLYILLQFVESECQ